MEEELNLKVTNILELDYIYYKNWYNGIMTAEQVYESDLFFELEYFIIFFFSDAFYKTIEIMKDLRIEKIDGISTLFKFTLLIYIILIVLFGNILIYLIHRLKKHFNMFLNFIGIIPLQYLQDDEDFYKDILNLGKNIF